MSGAQSSLISGGALPVGARFAIPGAPTNFTYAGNEYQRAGTVKAYDSSYAASIALIPALRVFGTSAKSAGSATSAGNWCRYFYVGSNYVSTQSGGSVRKATDPLGTWSATTSPPTPPSSSPYIGSAAVNGTSYMVQSWNTSNWAPKYTSNGSTWTAVGGSFTTFPANCAVGYGNSIWVAAAVLDGSTNIGYISAANPSGTWTITGSTNLSMTQVNGIKYDGSKFLCYGNSASATAGKLVTFTTPGGTWTDRTTGSGIVWVAAEKVISAVWDGTYWLALTDQGRLIRATDPTGAWTDLGLNVFDSATTNFVGTTGFYSNKPIRLVTDGAGTVVATGGTAAGNSIEFMTTDHGATWNAFQVYNNYAATAYVQASYTNGRWIFNKSGDPDTLIAPTDLTTPDSIGMQAQAYFGEMVRIK